MSWKTVRPDSIARRLCVLFTLVAASVFLLIGAALYLAVDRNLGRLPEAELDARYSVLESALNRYGNPEHWQRISSKLYLLAEEDQRLHFWVVSSNPDYEYGHPDEALRAFANGPSGLRNLERPGFSRPLRALVSDLPAKEQRPPLRFVMAIDTQTFWHTQQRLLFALVSLAALGVVLASVLGYKVARIGLRPLADLSTAAQRLAPPRQTGRLSVGDLPPELSQLAAAFNLTLEKVDQSWSQLEAFNADVAHELRSPLTNLIGQTQVALTRGRSAEHYFEVLQSNLEELERLRNIVNDMLFLASADQGERATSLSPASLAEEVATTLDYLDYVLEDAQVQVKVQGDAQVSIDKSQLRRALINLITNAARHTGAGQTIEIQIETHGPTARIAVSNPGADIAAEHLPRLFERFYRVDPSRNNPGGNHGLGLAIVKAIAQMHGGEVFVRSSGGVTTFGLQLPA